jgi:hypothetical protein
VRKRGESLTSNSHFFLVNQQTGRDLFPKIKAPILHSFTGLESFGTAEILATTDRLRYLPDGDRLIVDALRYPSKPMPAGTNKQKLVLDCHYPQM